MLLYVDRSLLSKDFPLEKDDPDWMHMPLSNVLSFNFIFRPLTHLFNRSNDSLHMKGTRGTCIRDKIFWATRHMIPNQGSAGSVLPEWFGQFYRNVTMTGECSSCLKQRTLWKNQHGSGPSRVGMGLKGRGHWGRGHAQWRERQQQEAEVAKCNMCSENWHPVEWSIEVMMPGQ